MTIEDGKIDSAETFLRKSVSELLLIVSQSLPFIGVSPYEAPTVIHLLSDQLMEKLRANLIEYEKRPRLYTWDDSGRAIPFDGVEGSGE